jgi:single-strand DNA-binding protein
MNKVIMYGSIGEPKFRDVNTKNGTREICSFGICQQEGKDASGNSVFAWYNVDFWLDKGSKLKQYIVKGARVIVEGELKTEKWTKDGVERSAIKIAARNLTLTGGKQEQAQPVEDDDDGDLPDFLR